MRVNKNKWFQSCIHSTFSRGTSTPVSKTHADDQGINVHTLSWGLQEVKLISERAPENTAVASRLVFEQEHNHLQCNWSHLYCRPTKTELVSTTDEHHNNLCQLKHTHAFAQVHDSWYKVVYLGLEGNRLITSSLNVICAGNTSRNIPAVVRTLYQWDITVRWYAAQGRWGTASRRGISWKCG